MERPSVLRWPGSTGTRIPIPLTFPFICIRHLSISFSNLVPSALGVVLCHHAWSSATVGVCRRCARSSTTVGPRPPPRETLHLRQSTIATRGPLPLLVLHRRRDPSTTIERDPLPPRARSFTVVHGSQPLRALLRRRASFSSAAGAPPPPWALSHREPSAHAARAPPPPRPLLLHASKIWPLMAAMQRVGREWRRRSE